MLYKLLAYGLVKGVIVIYKVYEPILILISLKRLGPCSFSLHFLIFPKLCFFALCGFCPIGQILLPATAQIYLI